VRLADTRGKGPSTCCWWPARRMPTKQGSMLRLWRRCPGAGTAASSSSN